MYPLWYRGVFLCCISSSKSVGSLPLLRQINCSMFWGINQPQSLPKLAGNNITSFTERAEKPAQISGPWGSHKPIWEVEDSDTAQCQQHRSPAHNSTKVPHIFHHVPGDEVLALPGSKLTWNGLHTIHDLRLLWDHQKTYARETLLFFWYLEQIPLLLHCQRGENPGEVYRKQKHALGQNRKSDAREKLFNQTLLLHPLIKSVWTVKAGHWTKHRCKAQHSCTRRKRPSTAIVAVAAWSSLVRNCCFWWVHFWSFSSLFQDWGRGTHTDFFFPWKKPKLLGSSLQDSLQPPH